MKPLARFAAGVAMTCAALAAAAPAAATTWASSSEPYYVWEDDVAQGAAYGDFYNYNNQSARSKSWQKDMRVGGQSVYVWTDWYFYFTKDVGGGNYQTNYFWYSDDETGHTTSGSWNERWIDEDLYDVGTAARGKVRVCEDHSFASDPCSKSGYPSFNY